MITSMSSEDWLNWMLEELDEKDKRRSGEMANTEDLKSSEVTPLAGSSPASGISKTKENLK